MDNIQFQIFPQLIKYFENKGMAHALSAVSTNYGSQLDCVFTKSLTCSSGFYESYFSDHKPMLISLVTVVNDCSNLDNHPIISHAIVNMIILKFT